MRKIEKKRVINKFNDVLAKIDCLELEYVYGNFDRPYDLEETDDTEEIIEIICNFEHELEYLECDIEDAINDLEEKLKEIKELSEKYDEVWKLIEKYT